MRVATRSANDSLRRLCWLLSLAFVAACADRTPPRITSLEVEPNENIAAPLAATLTLRASEPVTIRIELQNGGARWERSFDDLRTEHEIPILGIHAGERHDVIVTATDAAGNETAADAQSLDPIALPEGFPSIELQGGDPARMEPGLTMFSLMRWPEEGSDPEYGALVITNEAGAVVWYYVPGHVVEDSRMLRNGHILLNQGRGRGRMQEIDLLGNVVRSWHTARAPSEPPAESRLVDTDSFHHEVFETSSGNLVALSTEIRTFDDYRTSTEDPHAPRKRSHVVGDLVVEFAPDGAIERRLSLMDVLDPLRVSHSSLGAGFWSAIYPDELAEGLHDWAHTNGVFYDESSDAFVLSVRHQDAVVKIDGTTGELIWILGPHENWDEPWQEYLLTPVGELEWPYHQHSPELTPSGTILVFDNGTHRASAFEEKMLYAESYSRAVEYEVDEETMEVKEVWRYGGRPDERFFSSFVGDVDRLPHTGNVLVTDGGKISDAEWKPTERPGVYRWARIVELTHTTPAEIVFELHVKDEPPMGWHVYRAERVPALYAE